MGGAVAEAADAKLSKGARTRLRILDAAAAVLRDKGYAATRLSDIADVAGLRTGSLAFHFQSKNELIDEVLRHGMADGLSSVAAAVEALGPDASPAEQIEAAVHAHLDGLGPGNDYTPAILRMVDQFPADTRRRFRHSERAYVGYWRSLIGAAQDTGEVPAHLDTALLTRLTLGAMNATLGRSDTGPRHRLVAAVLFMIGTERIGAAGRPSTSTSQAP